MDKNVSGQSGKDSFKNTSSNVGSGMGADKNVGSSMNSGSANASDSSLNNASGISSSVSSAIGTARGAIADKAAPAMDYLKNNFSSVRDSSQVYLDDAEALIKRYPIYTVLGAAAIGAVVGMLMSRSGSSARENV